MTNTIYSLQETLKIVTGDTELHASFDKAATFFTDALARGNKILIAGNGGSAAEAQHLAAEIVGRFVMERSGYPAISLSTDTSILTAVGNDYGFDKIFSRQVDALGSRGDVLLSISTSGNSANIENALRAAKEKGMCTVTLTGKGGGSIKGISDVNVIIPSDITARIQEVHLILIHAWCEIIDANFK